MSILEAEYERIYGLYQAKSASFRKAFYALISLISVIFLLVFYPYVTKK